jgi:hypothetical protein
MLTARRRYRGIVRRRGQVDECAINRSVRTSTSRALARSARSCKLDDVYRQRIAAYLQSSAVAIHASCAERGGMSVPAIESIPSGEFDVTAPGESHEAGENRNDLNPAHGTAAALLGRPPTSVARSGRAAAPVGLPIAQAKRKRPREGKPQNAFWHTLRGGKSHRRACCRTVPIDATATPKPLRARPNMSPRQVKHISSPAEDVRVDTTAAP